MAPRHHLPRDLIGVDRRHAARVEPSQDIRLAGGNTTGEDNA